MAMSLLSLHYYNNNNNYTGCNNCPSLPLTSPLPLHLHSQLQLHRHLHVLSLSPLLAFRRPNADLDSVVQRRKKILRVSKITQLLLKQPSMVMSLQHLAKFRPRIGLHENRSIIKLLRKFPGVFEVFQEGAGSLYFRLTPEANEQLLREQECKEEMEMVSVTKLRKMLMMSVDKRLLLKKVSHLKNDLGFPDGIRKNLVEKHPDYFKVMDIEGETAVELASWDPDLAIAAAEKKKQRKRRSSYRPKPRKTHRPGRQSWKKNDKEGLPKFEDLPYISPYAEFTNLDPASLEAEKRACAVIHELLSLTIEKRTLIDHLTHFRRDYKFSQRIRSTLIRHPEMFYVSFKGDRDSVFLREAYRGAELIYKDPLVLVRERFAELVAFGQNHRVNEEDEEEEEDDEDDDDDDDDDNDEIDTEDEDEGKGKLEDDSWSDDEMTENRDVAIFNVGHDDGLTESRDGTLVNAADRDDEGLNGAQEPSEELGNMSAQEFFCQREDWRSSQIIEREHAVVNSSRSPKETR